MHTGFTQYLKMNLSTRRIYYAKRIVNVDINCPRRQSIKLFLIYLPTYLHTNNLYNSSIKFTYLHKKRSIQIMYTEENKSIYKP